jgi:hypothetical protein
MRRIVVNLMSGTNTFSRNGLLNTDLVEWSDSENKLRR